MLSWSIISKIFISISARTMSSGSPLAMQSEITMLA
jgi:hypothetical protein